ncbi:MAG: HAD family hydrolase [Candidatus Hydrogenedens sp.]|nr:HAD family hydrolase [Candidatus Hydrogenedens sp.]
MSDPTQALRDHQPSHDFLICIDSDGCAFDTMELKHKECFIPNIIKFWGLQPVSKFARDAAEFVNLYSQWRGINRFPALPLTFDLLSDWDKVQARKAAIPPIPNLRRWLETESKLGNPALQAYCDAHPDEEDMQCALAWSKAVNATVADVVGDGLPPFPYVRECLDKSSKAADMMVCSQTPTAALTQEWSEQGIADYVFAIAGQELGKKGEHIQFASEGRYQPDRILMIGDAPGDRKAAEQNGALFFPINPGEEDVSWKRLFEEGLDRFFNGTYRGAYQEALIADFERFLPDTPPWKR